MFTAFNSKATMSTASQLLKRRCLSTSSSAAALRRQAIKVSGAPPSIATIPDEGLLPKSNQAAAFIRQVGCTRRVFLLKPYMTTDELEGLAYRIRTLTKNDSINSVLVATDDTDNAQNGALPSSLMDRDYPYLRELSVDPGFPPQPGRTWHVAGGYDPGQVYQSGLYQNNEAVNALLTRLGNLALAMRGDERKTKVPTISIPHGHFHDGGFAVSASSTYVLATRESSFAIRHVSKGLSLDPVGLSYILPRLGQEFRQPAARYAGCGMLLGLTGYEANADDLMETGLATHYMETPVALGLLEDMLSEIRPWNQQGLLKEPIRFHGDAPPTRDYNAVFRNVQVADAVHCCTSYHANGNYEFWDNDETDKDVYIGQDASLEMETVPWFGHRSSDLVNYAATFDEIFTSEKTLTGIVERFREVAARTTSDPEEQEGIDVAQDFCRRFDLQSPLALSVVYRLLREGSKMNETLQSCMVREKRVQCKLFQMADFENWAQFASNNEKTPFTGWKHKSIADVSDDEVAELLAEP